MPRTLLTFPLTGSWPADASAVAAACPSVLEAALIHSNMPAWLGWQGPVQWLEATPIQRTAMMSIAVALYGMADRGELGLAAEAGSGGTAQHPFRAPGSKLWLQAGPRLGEAEPVGVVERQVIATLRERRSCEFEQALPQFTPSQWLAGSWLGVLAKPAEADFYEGTLAALRLAGQLLALYAHNGATEIDATMDAIEETLAIVEDALFAYVCRRLPGS